MRILGLDVGDKTIGVAVCDPLGWTAQGLETIRFKQISESLSRMKEIVVKYTPEKIVVGFPLNMNGTEGPRVEMVRQFADELVNYLVLRKVVVPEIIFWDERLSTVGAERSLLEADVSRAKRKQVIDKMAAVFLLQGYLNSILPQE